MSLLSSGPQVRILSGRPFLIVGADKCVLLQSSTKNYFAKIAFTVAQHFGIALPKPATISNVSILLVGTKRTLIQ